MSHCVKFIYDRLDDFNYETNKCFFNLHHCHCAVDVRGNAFKFFDRYLKIAI